MERFFVSDQSRFQSSDVKFNNLMGQSANRLIPKVPGLQKWELWFVDRKWKNGVLQEYILVLTSTKGKCKWCIADKKITTLLNHPEIFCTQQMIELSDIDTPIVDGETFYDGGIRFTYKGVEDWDSGHHSAVNVFGETLVAFSGSNDEHTDLILSVAFVADFVEAVKHECTESSYVNDFSGLKKVSESAALLLNLYGL